MSKTYKVVLISLMTAIFSVFLSVAQAAPVVIEGLLVDSKIKAATPDLFLDPMADLLDEYLARREAFSSVAVVEFGNSKDIDDALLLQVIDDVEVVIVSSMTHPAEKFRHANDSDPSYYAQGIDKVPWLSA